jgi:hypothetical protein
METRHCPDTTYTIAQQRFNDVRWYAVLAAAAEAVTAAAAAAAAVQERDI